VLFVGSECYPLVKTGGLADVMGALPLALAPLGVDARVLLPAYPGVAAKVSGRRTVATVASLFGGPGRLVSGRTADGLRVMLVDAPHLYERPGGPYLGTDGLDHPDNDVRFAALAHVGAQLALGNVGRWVPDVVHVHDWQAGLVPAYLHHAGSRVPSVLTIHNLAFQGIFPADRLAAVGLPASSFTIDGVEYHRQISFLKAGVQHATALTTVSPTYAQEIMTPAEGFGFEGLLQARAGVLTGITNGIDDAVWDPATDPALPFRYSALDVAGKARCKQALQAELGIEQRADLPLLGVVSRLSTQKGFDLLLDVLPGLLARGQLAVLGSGAPEIEAALREAAFAHPDRVGLVTGYDEALAHRIQGAADIVLVPSRFEPCGLTQLCGLRYGSLPLVSRVGGLADTVIDANDAALRDGVATGFVFSPVTADAFARALDRAFSAWSDEAQWQQLRARAMTRTVGWSTSAPAYRAVYDSVLRAVEV
jgi:starch synthase